MSDIPRIVFNWVSAQNAVTAAAVLGAGLISGFYGFRMTRFLLAAGMAAFGCAAVTFIPDSVPVPRLAAMCCAAVLGVCVGLFFRRTSVVLLSAATFGAVGTYMAVVCGIPGWGPWIACGVFAAAAATLAVVSTGPMTVLYTTLQGAVLTVAGAGGLARMFVPAVGTTFQGWVERQSVVVPILLGMVTVMAYSVQSTKRQGDTVTGR